MVWHDCKTDQPKKDGLYVLCYLLDGNKYYDCVYYFVSDSSWDDPDHYGLYSKIGQRVPYKWAEVDLSEVE